MSAGAWPYKGTHDGYTHVVDVPAEAWTRQNGLPGYAEVRVYRVEWEDENGPCYWRRDSPSNTDATPHLSEADPVAEGTVTWEGCFHFSVGAETRAHVCDDSELGNLSAALLRGYRCAVSDVLKVDAAGVADEVGSQTSPDSP